MRNIGNLAQLLFPSDSAKTIALLAISFFRHKSFSNDNVKGTESQEQTNY